MDRCVLHNANFRNGLYENMGKGENAGNLHFLLFQNIFYHREK